MSSTPLDPTTAQLLSHLHRGGSWAYWWTAPGKRATWWQPHEPVPVPSGRNNVYFGVHPTTAIPSTNARGEQKPPAEVRSQIAYIAAVNCLFGEFDAKHFDDKAATLAHIETLDPPPSTIVDSGGGYHCYWLLEQPFVCGDDADRQRAKRAQAGWVQHVGSDDDAKDLARVLRMPGTHNYKYDDAPEVHVIRADFDRLYTFEELEALIPAEAPPAGTDAQGTLPDVVSAHSFTYFDDIAQATRNLQRLAAWRCDKYQSWVDVGMALAELGQAGLPLWEHWSQRSDKYKPGECARKWATFTPSAGVTLASLGYWAKEDDPQPVAPSRSNGHSTNGNGAGANGKTTSYSPYSSMPTSNGTHPEAVPTVANCLLHADELSLLPKPEWLIPGVLPLNKISQLFGRPGSGKSHVLLDIAISVAQFAPVVYLAAEDAEDYQDRIPAWCAQHNLGAGQLHFWIEPVNLLNPDAVSRFLAEISPLQPKLIVIDTLANCMVGAEEDRSSDMGRAIDALNYLRRQTGAAIFVCHHTGWSDQHERGSSALRAACRVVTKLSQSDDGLLTLTCEKANGSQRFEPRYFRLIPKEDSVALIPSSKLTTRDTALTEKHYELLEALSLPIFAGGASHSQMVDHLEWPKSSVNYALSKLSQRELVEGAGKRYKLWTLTASGEAELDHHLFKSAEVPSAEVQSQFSSQTELRLNWPINVAATTDGQFSSSSASLQSNVQPVQSEFSVSSVPNELFSSVSPL
ncbi:MAG TPA: AAA family ATPase [Herpetosiphonaceae bacterium]|nr:AAA family ATPase [Herpetosiphonaceae bacterium]